MEITAAKGDYVHIVGTAAGQYYGTTERSGLFELNSNGQTILAMLSPNDGIQSSFVVEGSNRLQGRTGGKRSGADAYIFLHR